MKSFISFILLVWLCSNGFAQSVSSRVLVRNAGVVSGKQTVSVKWYSKDLLYPEGVNLYRKEGQGEWKKLNNIPVKKLADVASGEYDKDEELHFFVPLMNKAKKEDLKGLLLINILVKSFQSEAFSRFLGIQFEDTTVKAGMVYTYKVASIQGKSEVLLGESVPLRAGAETYEATVQDIVVKADTNKVTMKWRPEEQRYYAVNVYREAGGHGWLKLNKTPVMISGHKDSLGRLQYPKTFYLDDSLRPGTYTYQLAGIDFFGKETVRSESFTVEVRDFIPPPAPENLEDSIRNLTVVLSWKNQPADDIASVNVYRSSQSTGPFERLASLAPTAATYTDHVKKAGPYYYYVASVDSSGNEGKSYMKFSEVHDIVPPGRPAGLSAKADTGKVLLSWEMNREADLWGYRIYRTINSNDEHQFVLLNSTPFVGNSITDKLPKRARNKFLYKIIALDSSFNKSEASDIVAVQMPDVIPPVKPYLKSLGNLQQGFTIEWLANKDEDLVGYHLYRSSDNESYSRVNKEVIGASVLKWNDPTAAQGIDYFYYLRAVDSAGNLSEPSNILKGNNKAGKENTAPASVKVKYRKDKKDVQITWKHKETEDAVGYVVYRKEESHRQMMPITGQVKGNEYCDKDVTPGNTYFYEIRAFDKAGNVARSEVVKISLNR